MLDFNFVSRERKSAPFRKIEITAKDKPKSLTPIGLKPTENAIPNKCNPSSKETILV